MDRDPDFVIRYLAEVEAMAEDILTDKQEVVDLDRRRNTNREALRILQKEAEKQGENGKCWMALGNTFFKFPQSKSKLLLERDQVRLDAEINKVRSDLKVKVNKLRDMEGESPVHQYGLKPLSSSEVAAVRQVVAGKSV